MHAEDRESRYTQEGRTVSLAISSVTCWTMNTSPRTLLLIWVGRMNDY